MKTDKKPLLTIQEQRFYAYLRSKRVRPRQVDAAREFMVPRQRIAQLTAQLKAKGYL